MKEYDDILAYIHSLPADEQSMLVADFRKWAEAEGYSRTGIDSVAADMEAGVDLGGLDHG